MRYPLLAKALAIGLVIFLLSFVLLRIEWLVHERRMRQIEARTSVEQSLAGSQTLLGPVLHRACVEAWDVTVGEGKDKRTNTHKREFQLTSTPQSLHVVGEARAEPRYRGLFKVNGYAGTTVLVARWPTLDELVPKAEHKSARLECGPALVMAAVSDVRGIRSAQVHIDDAAAPVRAGTLHPRFPLGLHAEIPAARMAAPNTPLFVRLTVDLIGTSRLAVVPAAGETSWSLRSDWPHPSFVGRFLPAAREVGEAGFSARWTVSSLASSAAADVRGSSVLCTPAGLGDLVDRAAAAAPSETATPRCLDSLDVAFIDPINPYVLTDRATKYALLFIVLTFTGVALTEVLARRRVHPVQYTLVGLVLALFFLLLLSLSEHVGFDLAYMIASAACVVLLGFYAAHMLGRRAAGALFAAGAALLYGLLWTLLQMEQTALVIGSVMLFAALAAVMVLTRRVDWYALVERLRQDGRPEGKTHGAGITSPP